MKNVFKFKFLPIILSLIFTLFGTVIAYATDNDLLTPLSNEVEYVDDEDDYDYEEDDEDYYVDTTAGLQKTTVKEIQSKINEKTFDVVHVLQTFGKPFTIICFIAAALYLAVSLLMKNGSWGKACLAMFISALAYGLIASAPQIVQIVSNWIQS